ncbi:MAG: hypothetical protein ACPLY9_04410 [Nitrososphaerales archaeon]
MAQIDINTTLEKFRRFLINSTCKSFIPESYLRDPEVFPEKEGNHGSIYVEAVDKVTLKKIRDITFINANGILGIIYVSKSGNTRLKWRQIKGQIGRVTGEASANSLVNLIISRVLTREYAESLMGSIGEVKEQAQEVIEEEGQSVGGPDSASSNSENRDQEEIHHITEDE